MTTECEMPTEKTGDVRGHVVHILTETDDHGMVTGQWVFQSILEANEKHEELIRDRIKKRNPYGVLYFASRMIA